jgi:hypothetical protein
VRLSILPLICLSCLAASCQQSPITSPPVSKQEEQTVPAAKAPNANEVVVEEVKTVKEVAPVVDADLTQEFREIFKESAECRGIVFYTGEKKTPPDFKVQIALTSDDAADAEPEWLWTVRDARKRRGAEDELRGIGNQASAALAVRDVCITVWENTRAARK